MTRAFFSSVLIPVWLACCVGLAQDREVSGLHQPWDTLLSAHVKAGRVDYKAFGADEKKLDGYLAALGATDVAVLNRDEQLAFWINAYNAFTVKLILNHYPLKSIRDIDKPWARKEWVAGGKTLSLDEIEHEIIRKQFKEPRIHFAIVCASIGCPDLWNRAFTGADIDSQLSGATRRFVRSDKHVQLVKPRKFRREVTTLRVSRIFKWFPEDFTHDGGTVAKFVASYAEPELAGAIRSVPGMKLDYLSYDWDLNE